MQSLGNFIAFCCITTTLQWTAVAQYYAQQQPLYPYRYMHPTSTTRKTTTETDLLPSPPHCGAPVIKTRIANGSEAAIGEFPWMVRLGLTNGTGHKAHDYAGTLINNRYVLTAAHLLLNNRNWKVTSVRLGEWNTATNPDRACYEGICVMAPEVIDIDVEATIMHPLYKEFYTNNRHDIGLLRLRQPVQFSNFVRPICLPTSDELRAENFENYNMTVAGWNNMGAKNSSDQLLKATLPVVDYIKCTDLFKSFRVSLSSSQMCAGGVNIVDTCKGDGGGPLMYFKDNSFHIAGIVSMGNVSCRDDKIPDVFTKVSYYLDWLNETMYE